MRRNIFYNTFPKTLLATLGLVFLFGSASNSQGQVKEVEMHIAGYLCGN